jgi:hypothetical protein
MESEERSEKLSPAPGGAGEGELISQSTWGAVRDPREVPAGSATLLEAGGRDSPFTVEPRRSLGARPAGAAAAAAPEKCRAGAGEVPPSW